MMMMMMMMLTNWLWQHPWQEAPFITFLSSVILVSMTDVCVAVHNIKKQVINTAVWSQYISAIQRCVLWADRWTRSTIQYQSSASARWWSPRLKFDLISIAHWCRATWCTAAVASVITIHTGGYKLTGTVRRSDQHCRPDDVRGFKVVV